MSGKSAKKKRLGSRRVPPSQNVTSDEIHVTDNSSVARHHVLEESSGSVNVLSNPDDSKPETQQPPSPDITMSRRKLGSSRRNKGRQFAKDSETEPYLEHREEVEEKTRGNKNIETTQTSLAAQLDRQEESSQGSVQDISATPNSSLSSAGTPDYYYSEVKSPSILNSPEDVTEILTPEPGNLKAERAQENEPKLEKTDKSDTPQSAEMEENVGILESSQLGALSGISADQQLINIQLSNSKEMTKKKLSHVYSVAEMGSNKNDDTNLFRQDESLQGNTLESESQVGSVALESATDKSSPRGNTAIKDSIEQATILLPKEELPTNEKLTELFNLSELKDDQRCEDTVNNVHGQDFIATQKQKVDHDDHSPESLTLDASENADICAGNLKDQDEIGDVNPFEFSGKVSDDFAPKQEVSNPDDKQDEHPLIEADFKIEQGGDKSDTSAGRSEDNTQKVQEDEGQTSEMQQMENLSASAIGDATDNSKIVEIITIPPPEVMVESIDDSANKQEVSTPTGKQDEHPTKEDNRDATDNTEIFIDLTEIRDAYQSMLAVKSTDDDRKEINFESSDPGKEFIITTPPHEVTVESIDDSANKQEVSAPTYKKDEHPTKEDNLDATDNTEIFIDLTEIRDAYQSMLAVKSTDDDTKEINSESSETGKEFIITTPSPEVTVESIDDSANKQEVSTPTGKQDEHPTKEDNRDATDITEIFIDLTEIRDAYQSMLAVKSTDDDTKEINSESSDPGKEFIITTPPPEVTVESIDDSANMEEVSAPTYKKDEHPTKEDNLDATDNTEIFIDLTEVRDAYQSMLAVKSTDDDTKEINFESSDPGKEFIITTPPHEVTVESIDDSANKQEVSAPTYKENEHPTKEDNLDATDNTEIFIDLTEIRDAYESMLAVKSTDDDTKEINSESSETGKEFIIITPPPEVTVESIDDSATKQEVSAPTYKKDEHPTKEDNLDATDNTEIFIDLTEMRDAYQSMLAVKSTDDDTKEINFKFSETGKEFIIITPPPEVTVESIDDSANKQEVSAPTYKKDEHPTKEDNLDATDNTEIFIDLTEMRDAYQSMLAVKSTDDDTKEINFKSSETGKEFIIITPPPEVTVESIDDSATKQEVSTPTGKQDGHPTKEDNLEALNQISEDNPSCDTKTPQVSDIERVDTAQVQVSESEGRVVDDVKHNSEQTVHQGAAQLSSEMKDIAFSQSQKNVASDSQPHDRSVSFDVETNTGFQQSGIRRKLGSSRRNKRRQKIKDNKPTDEADENIIDQESSETTETPLTTKTADQEKQAETMLEGMNKFNTQTEEEKRQLPDENLLDCATVTDLEKARDGVQHSKDAVKKVHDQEIKPIQMQETPQIDNTSVTVTDDATDNTEIFIDLTEIRDAYQSMLAVKSTDDDRKEINFESSDPGKEFIITTPSPEVTVESIDDSANKQEVSAPTDKQDEHPTKEDNLDATDITEIFIDLTEIRDAYQSMLAVKSTDDDTKEINSESSDPGKEFIITTPPPEVTVESIDDSANMQEVSALTYRQDEHSTKEDNLDATDNTEIFIDLTEVRDAYQSMLAVKSTDDDTKEINFESSDPGKEFIITTPPPEVTVESIDDSENKQEVSAPTDKQDEHPTKEDNLDATDNSEIFIDLTEIRDAYQSMLAVKSTDDDTKEINFESSDPGKEFIITTPPPEVTVESIDDSENKQEVSAPTDKQDEHPTKEDNLDATDNSEIFIDLTEMRDAYQSMLAVKSTDDDTKEINSESSDPGKEFIITTPSPEVTVESIDDSANKQEVSAPTDKQDEHPTKEDNLDATDNTEIFIDLTEIRDAYQSMLAVKSTDDDRKEINFESSDPGKEFIITTPPPEVTVESIGDSANKQEVSAPTYKKDEHPTKEDNLDATDNTEIFIDLTEMRDAYQSMLAVKSTDDDTKEINFESSETGKEFIIITPPPEVTVESINDSATKQEVSTPTGKQDGHPTKEDNLEALNQISEDNPSCDTKTLQVSDIERVDTAQVQVSESEGRVVDDVKHNSEQTVHQGAAQLSSEMKDIAFSQSQKNVASDSQPHDRSVSFDVETNTGFQQSGIRRKLGSSRRNKRRQKIKDNKPTDEADENIIDQESSETTETPLTTKTADQEKQAETMLEGMNKFNTQTEEEKRQLPDENLLDCATVTDLEKARDGVQHSKDAVKKVHDQEIKPIQMQETPQIDNTSVTVTDDATDNTEIFIDLTEIRDAYQSMLAVKSTDDDRKEINFESSDPGKEFIITTPSPEVTVESIDDSANKQEVSAPTDKQDEHPTKQDNLDSTDNTEIFIDLTEMRDAYQSMLAVKSTDDDTKDINSESSDPGKEFIITTPSPEVTVESIDDSENKQEVSTPTGKQDEHPTKEDNLDATDITEIFIDLTEIRDAYQSMLAVKSTDDDTKEINSESSDPGKEFIITTPPPEVMVESIDDSANMQEVSALTYRQDEHSTKEDNLDATDNTEIFIDLTEVRDAYQSMLAVKSTDDDRKEINFESSDPGKEFIITTPPPEVTVESIDDSENKQEVSAPTDKQDEHPTKEDNLDATDNSEIFIDLTEIRDAYQSMLAVKSTDDDRKEINFESSDPGKEFIITTPSPEVTVESIDDSANKQEVSAPTYKKDEHPTKEDNLDATDNTEIFIDLTEMRDAYQSMLAVKSTDDDTKEINFESSETGKEFIIITPPPEVTVESIDDSATKQEVSTPTGKQDGHPTKEDNLEALNQISEDNPSCDTKTLQVSDIERVDTAQVQVSESEGRVVDDVKHNSEQTVHQGAAQLSSEMKDIAFSQSQKNVASDSQPHDRSVSFDVETNTGFQQSGIRRKLGSSRRNKRRQKIKDNKPTDEADENIIDQESSETTETPLTTKTADQEKQAETMLEGMNKFNTQTEEEKRQLPDENLLDCATVTDLEKARDGVQHSKDAVKKVHDQEIKPIQMQETPQIDNTSVTVTDDATDNTEIFIDLTEIRDAYQSMLAVKSTDDDRKEINFESSDPGKEFIITTPSPEVTVESIDDSANKQEVSAPTDKQDEHPTKQDNLDSTDNTEIFIDLTEMRDAYQSMLAVKSTDDDTKDINSESSDPGKEFIITTPSPEVTVESIDDSENKQEVSTPTGKQDEHPTKEDNLDATDITEIFIDLTEIRDAYQSMLAVKSTDDDTKEINSESSDPGKEFIITTPPPEVMVESIDDSANMQEVSALTYRQDEHSTKEDNLDATDNTEIFIDLTEVRDAYQSMLAVKSTDDDRKEINFESSDPGKEFIITTPPPEVTVESIDDSENKQEVSAPTDKQDEHPTKEDNLDATDNSEIFIDLTEIRDAYQSMLAVKSTDDDRKEINFESSDPGKEFIITTPSPEVTVESIDNSANKQEVSAPTYKKDEHPTKEDNLDATDNTEIFIDLTEMRDAYQSMLAVKSTDDDTKEINFESSETGKEFIIITPPPEVTVESIDDSATKQEVSTPTGKQDGHPTKEDNLDALNQISEDNPSCDTKTPQISDIERVDTAQVQVSESEGRVVDDVKHNSEQTVHQGAAQLSSEMKDIAFSQSQKNVAFDSQPHDRSMSFDVETNTGFQQSGIRRKLGSSRRNKRRQKIKDNKPTDAADENIIDQESSETTETPLTTKTADQEKQAETMLEGMNKFKTQTEEEKRQLPDENLLDCATVTDLEKARDGVQHSKDAVKKVHDQEIKPIQMQETPQIDNTSVTVTDDATDNTEIFIDLTEIRDAYQPMLAVKSTDDDRKEINSESSDPGKEFIITTPSPEVTVESIDDSANKQEVSAPTDKQDEHPTKQDNLDSTDNTEIFIDLTEIRDAYQSMLAVKSTDDDRTEINSESSDPGKEFIIITPSPEVTVESIDDSATKQEISTPTGKQDEHPTKEDNLEALNQISEDNLSCDTKTPQVSDIERVDTAQVQVSESEGRGGDGIKPNPQQAFHQEATQLSSEMEDIAFSQLETNVASDSQPHDRSASIDMKTNTGFQQSAIRRKLGSSRRNKGRQQVKDNKPTEEADKNKSDHESNETSEMPLTTETADQENPAETKLEGMNKFNTHQTKEVNRQLPEEKVLDFASGTDLEKGGDGTQHSEDALKTVHDQEIKPIQMQETPQIDNTSVSVIDDATGNTEIFIDLTEIRDAYQSMLAVKSTDDDTKEINFESSDPGKEFIITIPPPEVNVESIDDSATKQKVSTPTDNQDKHPTKEDNLETLNQISEDNPSYDTKTQQISDIERVDTAQVQVSESEGRVVDDVKPNPEQTVHQGTAQLSSEMEDIAFSQSQTIVASDSQPHDSSVSFNVETNTDFQQSGIRRKLGSSRRNKGRQQFKDNKPTEEADENKINHESSETLTTETDEQEKLAKTMLEGMNRFNTQTGEENRQLPDENLLDFASVSDLEKARDRVQHSKDAVKKVHGQESKSIQMQETPQINNTSVSVTDDATDNIEIFIDLTEVRDAYQSMLAVKSTDDDTKKINFESSDPGKEADHVFDSTKPQLNVTERADTALGDYVIESQVKDDIKSSAGKTGRQEAGLLSEMEDSESSLQSLQHELHPALDSNPQQNNTSFNSGGNTRKLGSGQEKSMETMLEGKDKSDSAQIKDTVHVKQNEHFGPLDGISEFTSSSLHPSPVVDRQQVESNSSEMPDKGVPIMSSVTENKEKDENAELVRQDGRSQGSDLFSESYVESENTQSPTTVEITTENSSSREHTKVESSVEQSPKSAPKKELALRGEQNECFNPFEVTGAEQSEDVVNKEHEKLIHPIQVQELLQTDTGPISCLQALPSEINTPLDSQQDEPQRIKDESPTGPKPEGSRRKLGSSRRNKGRQYAKEEAKENTRDDEASKILNISLATETAKQGELTDIKSAEKIRKISSTVNEDDNTEKLPDKDTFSTDSTVMTADNDFLKSNNDVDDKEKKFAEGPENLCQLTGYDTDKIDLMQPPQASVRTDNLYMQNISYHDDSLNVESKTVDILAQEEASQLQNTEDLLRQDVGVQQTNDVIETVGHVMMESSVDKQGPGQGEIGQNFEDSTNKIDAVQEINTSHILVSTAQEPAEDAETGISTVMDASNSQEEEESDYKGKLQVKSNQKKRKLGSTRRRLIRKQRGETDNKDETTESEVNTEADVRNLDEMEDVKELVLSADVSHNENATALLGAVYEEQQEGSQISCAQDEGHQLESSTSNLQSSESNVTPGRDDLMALLPEPSASHSEEAVDPNRKKGERNVNVGMEPSQLEEFTSSKTQISLIIAERNRRSLDQLLPLNTDTATNTGITGGSPVLSETTETTQNDDKRAESATEIQGQDSTEQKPNIAIEETQVKIPEMKNASPNLTPTNRRRKMGSTRRNLGSRNKGEDLDNEATETEIIVGDVKTERVPGIKEKELLLHTEHDEGDPEQERLLETVEYSQAGEYQSTPPTQQTAEKKPVPQGELVDTEQQTPNYLPSTSTKNDTVSMSASGGRRRKMGSHRKSRGHQGYGDQTEEQEGILDEQNGVNVRSSPEDGANKPYEEHKEEPLGLQKISEGDDRDKEPSSNIIISKPEEHSRPVSEKTPFQPSRAENRPGQEQFSLAGESGGAGLTSDSYHVVMIGDSSVGKTSFMKRAQTGKFSLNIPSSIGLDSCMWTVVVDGKPVVLELWDTAGQERFRSITRHIFHKAQAFLLMYDITCTESFHAVSYWANCIQESAADDVIVLLLGNKSDCAKRQVETEQGEILAKEYNFEFMECSAATGENVVQCLEAVARTLDQKIGTREEATVVQQEAGQKKRSTCC